MNTMKLDLSGLKCPLPALKTRKALTFIEQGDRLEVHCTDPLSAIDIPNLLNETGDRLESTDRDENGNVFLIIKTSAPVVKRKRP
ncbi:sulfurtransferase TusA family protein [Mesorhizobium sp. INR15]|uniref:sulfurtransferase TusA family protein n=1 Tax=Mesorhizobium sp. INR15 TaxID=2654248 RepID=UPI0018965C19|nr:sulfurtransferase TusA family protein [Mesorhizobium sp. INR15]QPC95442.1 response regulator SirA [Mesorhizobium sp. INR15]QPC95893.1 response regulator SirA [Mesorhizobium sp. INR15]